MWFTVAMSDVHKDDRMASITYRWFNKKNMRFDIQFNVHLTEFVIIVQSGIRIQYNNQVRFIAVIQKITAWFGLSVWRFIRNPHSVHCVKNIFLCLFNSSFRRVMLKPRPLIWATLHWWLLLMRRPLIALRLETETSL